ncbi:LysR family transcriptional regulator [Roseovarius faecimaris]|uniref:LysR family transcriptional regulator n=1 Tax=Roseovarius faecimaris TaxID=2494550 RepID=A0A6I6IVR7_9RHOB|nr:LysR family transcriptional regulator [Roseovarius faecimaris]QGX99587.1 LysR family transcriptional regulator [Roseovarius faecimaris]
MSDFANKLDWNLLRVFMVVMQEKNMTKAAAALYRTQPAVSQAMKRLEESAGVQLFERRRSGLLPTRAGQELLEQIRPIFASIARMPQTFSHAPRAVSGKVVLAAIDQVMSPEIDRAIEQFFYDHPAVDLEITIETTEKILRAVTLGTVTLGITDGTIPDGLEARELLRERFGLFCGRNHPLYGRRDVSISDLRAEPFIGFNADVLGGKHMNDVTAYRAKVSIGQRVRGQSPYVNQVRRMIELGLGIGFLPLHLAEPFVAKGSLWRLPPYSEEPSARVYLVTNSEIQLSEAEKLFWDYVEAHVKQAGPISGK